LAELDDAFPASESGEVQQRKRLSVFRLREMLAMSGYKLRMAFPSLAIVLATLVFLFGGAGIVASAAGNAVPGDALYGMKTGIEQARLTFASSALGQGSLFLEFAQRRMDEIQAMAQAKRFDEIPGLQQDVERYLEQAQAAANSLSASDAQAANQLQERIQEMQTAFQKLMEQVRAQMPDDTPPVQPTPGVDDNSNGNANTNGNANESNTNGNANGNENEANTNGNANGNENEANTNGNANENENEANTNGNANGNENEANTNGNANGNENEANTNGNANENENEANVNDDSGSNSNDSDSNSNDSGGNINDSGGNTNDSGGNTNDSSGNTNDSGGGSGGGQNGNDDAIRFTP
jgi:hypothetical protein